MSTPLCDTCVHKKVCSLKKDYLDILGSCELEVSNRGQTFNLTLGCNHHLREKPEFLLREMHIPTDAQKPSTSSNRPNSDDCKKFYLAR